MCSAWSLVGCRGETRVSLLYGVLPVISPRGLTDDASLYLLNPRRLVCRGVVSRDVHTLRHITRRPSRAGRRRETKEWKYRNTQKSLSTSHARSIGCSLFVRSLWFHVTNRTQTRRCDSYKSRDRTEARSASGRAPLRRARSPPRPSSRHRPPASTANVVMVARARARAWAAARA